MGYSFYIAAKEVSGVERQPPALGSAPFVGILSCRRWGGPPSKIAMGKKIRNASKCGNVSTEFFPNERSRENFSESGNLIERYCYSQSAE